MTITRKNLVFVFALLMIVLMVLASAQEDQAQKMAFDITGSFEGGKPNSLQTYDAGIISYGMHQATLASGSLYNVLERYTELSKTSNSEGISKYLLRVESRDITLRNDEVFLNLLRDAASESAMVQAQNEIFSKHYYEPAKDKAATDGVTSPLGIAIYYDTNIQGGLEYIRRATNENFIQSTPTEQEWLSSFLDERRNYLLAVADNKRKEGLENDAKYLENSASSKGRLGVLENLVDAGNLNLDQGDSNQQISLGIFGKIYTIDSEFRADNYERAPSKENDGMVDATSLPADVLLVGIPQYPVSWQEKHPGGAPKSKPKESSTSSAVDGLLIGTPQSPVVWQEKDTKIEEPTQSTKEYVDLIPTSYKSTIPIPTGPAADALKAQGKYEDYMQNALQAAEERIAKDPQDGDAWRTKALALYYLDRGAESETALAKANELSHGYASEENRITSEPNFELPSAISDGLQPIIQTIQPSKSMDESNLKESSSIPTLYPTTSPPPDESKIKEGSFIPTLYPTHIPPPDESDTKAKPVRQLSTLGAKSDGAQFGAQSYDTSVTQLSGSGLSKLSQSGTQGSSGLASFGGVPKGMDSPTHLLPQSGAQGSSGLASFGGVPKGMGWRRSTGSWPQASGGYSGGYGFTPSGNTYYDPTAEIEARIEQWFAKGAPGLQT